MTAPTAAATPRLPIAVFFAGASSIALACLAASSSAPVNEPRRYQTPILRPMYVNHGVEELESVTVRWGWEGKREAASFAFASCQGPLTLKDSNRRRTWRPALLEHARVRTSSSLPIRRRLVIMTVSALAFGRARHAMLRAHNQAVSSGQFTINLSFHPSSSLLAMPARQAVPPEHSTLLIGRLRHTRRLHQLVTSKHSQYFLRHFEFLHRQPRTWCLRPSFPSSNTESI